MTAFAALPAPSLPRRAIIISIAIHAGAFFLLPGLARQAERLELPPLVATLRLAATAQPAAPAPQAASIATPSRPQPTPPRQVREESRLAPVAVARNEAAPAPVQAAPAPAPVILDERPAPAPRPAPVAPSPAVPDGLALDDYGRALSEILARQQQYPRLAALRGWEGEVRLRLKVARKGALVAVQVVTSSGHEVLDQHALQLVQGAALPAPPDNLGDREIQVVVPIHFKLQRST